MQNQGLGHEIFAPNCDSVIYYPQYCASNVRVPHLGYHACLLSLSDFKNSEFCSKPRKINEETFCLFPTHKVWRESQSFAKEVKPSHFWEGGKTLAKISETPVDLGFSSDLKHLL